MKRGVGFAIAAVLGLGTLLSHAGLAQDALSPRLQIGSNLLPAIIAANNGIADLSENSSLKVYIVYLADGHGADLVERNISRVEQVKKRRLETSTLSLDELLQRNVEPMSTLFVAEPMDERLDELIAFSKARRVLLFSPYEDDVARGVATGFHVTDRVRPWVNMESLRQSKIQLKAFFLRIAVKHE